MKATEVTKAKAVQEAGAVSMKGAQEVALLEVAEEAAMMKAEQEARASMAAFEEPTRLKAVEDAIAVEDMANSQTEQVFGLNYTCFMP